MVKTESNQVAPQDFPQPCSEALAWRKKLPSCARVLLLDYVLRFVARKQLELEEAAGIPILVARPHRVRDRRTAISSSFRNNRNLLASHIFFECSCLGRAAFCPT